MGRREMITLSFIIIISYYLIPQAVAAKALENGALGSAIQSYNKMSYRAARDYFEKARGEGLKDEKAKLIRYAVKVMAAFEEVLNDIEKKELLFRKNAHDRAMAQVLAEKHYLFAKRLMETEFYLAMVEPHLKRAITLDPGYGDACMALGSAYYASMRYVSAVDSYEKAARLLPYNLYAYKMAGDACVAIGDFDRAKKFYSDLIKENDAAVLKYDPAEIEMIKRIAKSLPETYKDIDELLAKGDADRAEEILKKRVSLNGADYIAMTALGNIYQDRGDRKMALRLFETATKVAPDYPIAHLFLGRLFFLMQKYEKAVSELKAFKEKMNLLPKMDAQTQKRHINCLYYLSEVYFTLKRYEDAKKETDQILKMDPNEQDAYYNLGVYYYIHEHSRSKAYNSFKKAVDLDPTTDAAKRATYAIEFIRNNPDSRFVPDFSFIDNQN